MATAEQRDKKIHTAQTAVNKLTDRRGRLERQLREVQEEINLAADHLAWVKEMPVDDQHAGAGTEFGTVPAESPEPP